MSTAPTAPARPSGIADWIREHRIAVFFGLTFLLSWWAWPFYLVGLAPTAFFPCGPLVAAIIVIGVTEGWRGYRDWGARMLRWRVGWVWWVVAIGTPLAVLALASAANVAIWGAPAPVLTALPWSSIALFAALRLSTRSTGRSARSPAGAATRCPSCRSGGRRSPRRLVLAPLVALWHLPLVTTGQLAAVGIPITFAITLVYVWLFNRTGGSVLLTIVFHIAQGTFSYGVLGFAGCRRGPDGLARRRAVVRASPSR